MSKPPLQPTIYDADVLAARLRAGILEELSKIRAYHMQREIGFRNTRKTAEAEIELQLSNAISGALVTAQSVVNRVLGVNAANPPPIGLTRQS
jgi:hypothetical protein